MAKTKQFEKVLEVLRAASPASVSREDLVNKLGGDIEMYRISTYIWEVKNKAGVPVEAVKDGRKVIGWFVPSEMASVVEEPAEIERASADEDEDEVAATA